MVGLLVTGHMSRVTIFQVGLEEKAKEFKETSGSVYAKA
jgi:hypothetical protein